MAERRVEIGSVKMRMRAAGARYVPYVLLVAAAGFWSGNFVIGRAIVHGVPPLTLSFIRWLLASLLLLPFSWRAIWQHRATYRARAKTIVLLTLTGIVGFNTLLYIAVQYTTSINASLVNMATPIAIVALSWLLLGERIRLLQAAGIAVSTAGVLWITAHGAWTTIASLSFNRGDLWMLGAVSSWGLYSVVIKKTADRFPPFATFALTVMLGTLVLAPFAAYEAAVGATIAWSWPLVAGFFYIGLFASIVAILSWNAAVQIVGPARAANFLYLMPLFISALAVIFLDEKVHLYHAVGGALILLGVTIATRRRPGATLQPGRSRARQA